MILLLKFLSNTSEGTPSMEEQALPDENALYPESCIGILKCDLQPIQ